MEQTEEVISPMKFILPCALGVLVLALWTVPCRADHCSGPGCSSCATSCCNPCDRCKPTLWQRFRDWCNSKKCCDDSCAAPACTTCNDCCRVTLLDRLREWCRKKKDCCDDACCHATHAAPAPAQPERIGAPLPKAAEAKQPE